MVAAYCVCGMTPELLACCLQVLQSLGDKVGQVLQLPQDMNRPCTTASKATDGTNISTDNNALVPPDEVILRITVFRPDMPFAHRKPQQAGPMLFSSP